MLVHNAGHFANMKAVPWTISVIQVSPVDLILLQKGVLKYLHLQVFSQKLKITFALTLCYLMVVTSRPYQKNFKIYEGHLQSHGN